MTDATSRTEARSTASLFSDTIHLVLGLLRKEVDLVKAEVSESAQTAAVAVGLIVGGVVFVLVALNVLSGALVAGLAELGLETGWAALIVGVVYLLIAVVLVRRGMRDLKSASLAPKRAAESVRQDALVLKERLHG